MNDVQVEARLVGPEHLQAKKKMMERAGSLSGVITPAEVISLWANILGVLIAFEYVGEEHTEGLRATVSGNIELGVLEGQAQVAEEG